MKINFFRVNFIFILILGLIKSEALLASSSLIYETYLESWDSGWNSAMTGLPPIPSSSPTSYNNVTLNIAFASYTFPGLNGVQFSNPTSDTNTVINYVHSQNGKCKISYGGASYAGPNYFISQTNGWPNNISTLVTGVSNVVTTYNFDGVDFDIEDPLPNGTTADAFANQLFSFLTQMRAALPNKIISLTIPGQGWGTYWEILAKKVASAGIVNSINFMEYDIWIGTPTYAGQIQADIITYTSPTDTSPAPNYSPGWGIPPNLINLGLMPGNDDISQFLSDSDAKDLTTFAISNKLFGVMTWDLDRDAGTNPVPSLGGATPYEYSNTIRNTLYSLSNSKKGSIHIKKNKLNKSKKKARKHKPHFHRQLPPLHGAPR